MSVSKRLKCLAAGVALLAAAGTAQADWIDKWVNGFYYENADPSPRRGLGVQYIPAGPEIGFLFVAYYTYDEQGNPLWLQGAGIVRSDQYSVDIPLELVEGGSFGDASGNPATTDPNWGVGTFTVNSCNDVTWSWTSNNVADGSNSMASTNEVSLLYANGQPASECVYQQPFTACPDFATAGADPRTCIIPGGEYTEDLHLTNNTLWVLNGAVYVGSRETAENTNAIYIEPGTRIVGLDQSLLGIQRGAKIFAEGAPHAPIVMTGQYTASDAERPGAAGDWGGVTVNGLSYINTCDTLGACEAQGEGESGLYGGNDPHDSSGVMRYVRIQFAGVLYSDTNELNGIALQGVGDGTVLENIQVHANQDDGIEFFGGTVNARNIVITYAEDDSIDWTQGWQGRLQNALVIQNPEPEKADRGIEADNNGSANDATPRAKPELANITIIGSPTSTGATFRAGTGVNVTNMVITGSNTCVDIDDAATFTNAGTPAAPTGNLTMENTILDCTTTYSDNESGDPWLVSDFFGAMPNNMESAAGLDGVFPASDAMYLMGFPLDRDRFGHFFNNLEHVGAFTHETTEAWTLGWTLPMTAYDK